MFFHHKMPYTTMRVYAVEGLLSYYFSFALVKTGEHTLDLCLFLLVICHIGSHLGEENSTCLIV